MVGILIISHCKELAEGTKRLAQEMVPDSFPIEAVGGSKDGSLGTDPNLIRETLAKMDKEDGVLVFVDMGSAVMNAEMAFEFFAEATQKKFAIANAPIVEGAITASLEASFGKSLDEIISFLKSEDLLQKQNK